MLKTTFQLSLLIFIITVMIAAYAWLNLPDLEQYPIHWNAKGEADGFGSKQMVGFTLFMMPLSMLFMIAVFVVVPIIEPKKTNLQNNARAYSVIWISTVLLIAIISFAISYAYIRIGRGESTRFSPNILTVALSIMFIVIGSVMGKIKQNYFIGVRTPWTLRSDLAWEKSQKLAGWLWVISGVIGLVMVFIAPPATAIVTLVALVLISAIISVIYSYFVWKDDPNKQS